MSVKALNFVHLSPQDAAKSPTPQCHTAPSVSGAPEDANSALRRRFRAVRSTREGGHRQLWGPLGTTGDYPKQGYRHFMGDQLPGSEKETSWAGKPRRVCKTKGYTERRSDCGFALINSAQAGMIFCRSHEQRQVESHVLNGILALSSE